MVSHRITIILTALVAIVGTAVWGQPRPPADDAIVREFRNRIGEYAALHQKLEAGLPPIRPDDSLRTYQMNRAYLASAIKAARPHAKQGDIFTPAVSALFKRILARVLEGDEALDRLYDYDETHPFLSPYHPRVYDPYPEWATHATPVAVLQHLPALPDDIEYHILDHDLVLWDIHADLIVDLLPDAIARARPRVSVTQP